MAAAGPERLRLVGVSKGFRTPGGRVEVLQEVSLSLAAGGFGVVTGPSGSGKSTLLMIAGLLQEADAGEVWFDGREVTRLGEGERTEIRKHGAGMVFQKFCLLPRRSALENVRFRFRYLNHGEQEARDLAESALARVGLAHKAGTAARLLSAGEMQRVAIARAVALPPKLLLADEPTGNLDAESAAQVMGLLQELNRGGMSILLVTHDPAWTGAGTDHWVMRAGRLQGEVRGRMSEVRGA